MKADLFIIGSERIITTEPETEKVRDMLRKRQTEIPQPEVSEFPMSQWEMMTSDFGVLE